MVGELDSVDDIYVVPKCLEREGRSAITLESQHKPQANLETSRASNSSLKAESAIGLELCLEAMRERVELYLPT